MNIHNIGKQLKRDINNNPKKALFLGILLVLGLYFWAPFFERWITKGKEGSESPSGTQTMVNTPLGQTSSGDKSTAEKENKSRRYNWKEVVNWMSNDPRTRPAEPLTITRDPFQSSKDTLEKNLKDEEANIKPPPVSPASLGMALTSTLIGPGGGIARIGGRTYNRGQIIEAEKEGRNYKFILTEIQDRRVVLEMEGERFELSIPEPGMSGHMVLGTAGK